MEYVLHRKSNCKKIKIRVVKGVVQVSAPFYVSKREIDDFVKEQETWIQNQLSKYTVSKENDKIPLLGNEFSFNVNLIFMPLEFVDAIILHELAHLYHLNHSKEFYDLLCTWMPNYKEIMKKNKKNPIPNLY